MHRLIGAFSLHLLLILLGYVLFRFLFLFLRLLCFSPLSRLPSLTCGPHVLLMRLQSDSFKYPSSCSISRARPAPHLRVQFPGTPIQLHMCSMSAWNTLPPVLNIDWAEIWWSSFRVLSSISIERKLRSYVYDYFCMYNFKTVNFSCL